MSPQHFRFMLRFHSPVQRSTTLLLPVLFGLLSSTMLQARGQRVHYRMWIDMKTATHSYEGRQELTYWNQSSDTIYQVEYHLFYNAFKPESGMDRRDRSIPAGGWKQINSIRPDEEGDVDVHSLTQDGVPVTYTIDETVMYVTLAHPLKPGDSTRFDMTWTTVIPKLKRRGGWMSDEGVEFSMSQWYPKIAEYDENGSHPDEYIEREFYGVFGTYDVEITLPSSYMVGGTGIVTNPADVRSGYELVGRDTIIGKRPNVAGNTTWKFHAEKVHDFAWVADRNYIHGVFHIGTTQLHILVLSSTIERYPAWRNSAGWTAAILQYYSERFGPYAWPSFTVAQGGDGGMEYPMLIMITGVRGPVSLFRVIAHEAGHQWYYGMMANNETQQAWLDEGITQYITDEADLALRNVPEGNPLKGLNRLVYPWTGQTKWKSIEPAYNLAIKGYDEPLITYHDRFMEGTTASLVYSRGEAIVRQLQYMLGDSLFDEGMRRYYQDWRFDHPDQRDFEHSMELASGMRLDWFFNQWLGFTKTCDYALTSLSSVKRSHGESGWTTRVELENRDQIIMPIDLLLTYEDGTTALANIPTEPWKKPRVTFHLPRWFWIDREYSATFTTPKRVVRAEIDPSGLLFDIDRTNNTARTGFFSWIPSAHIALWKRWDMDRPIDHYSVRYYPTIAFDSADGLRFGLRADGGYLFDRYNASLGLAYNVGSHRFDYLATYDSPTSLIGKLSRLSLSAQNNGGVEEWRIGLTRDIRPTTIEVPVVQKVGGYLEHLRLLGPTYPNSRILWDSGSYQIAGLTYSLSQSGWRSGLLLRGEGRASFGTGSGFVQGTIRGRAFRPFLGGSINAALNLGTTAGEAPVQERFGVTGSSMRDHFENPISRYVIGIAPSDASHAHLFLPSPTPFASLTADSVQKRTAQHVAAASVRYELPPLSTIVNVLPFNRMRLSLYGSFGWFVPESFSRVAIDDYSAEFGAMISLDVIRLLPQVLQDLIASPVPVTLSAYLPVWSRSPFLTRTNNEFRFGIGISSAAWE